VVVEWKDVLHHVKGAEIIREGECPGAMCPGEHVQGKCRDPITQPDLHAIARKMNETTTVLLFAHALFAVLRVAYIINKQYVFTTICN